MFQSLVNVSLDIPRTRAGHLGAHLWTIWTLCPEFLDADPGLDPLELTNGRETRSKSICSLLAIW